VKIGLISDTHIPEAGKELPPQIYLAFQGVDLILHAGDMHITEVLDWLESIAPVVAAQGNGDGSSGRPPFPDDDPRVKYAQTLDLQGLKVGVIHWYPVPGEMPESFAKNFQARHFTEPLDIVVCGDTHVARVDQHEGVLMINPGSPTLPNNSMPRLGTVAILTIEQGSPSVEMINLSDIEGGPDWP
jgi:putative phosphoesterase